MWGKVEKKQGPIYRQIMEQIMREIESGRINPGDQLESERKLGQFFWCKSFHRCSCIGRT